jgi:hypothetical protein
VVRITRQLDGLYTLKIGDKEYKNLTWDEVRELIEHE